MVAVAHRVQSESRRETSPRGKSAEKSPQQARRGRVLTLATARERRAWAIRAACAALDVRIVDLASMLGVSRSVAGRVLTGEDSLTDEMVGALAAHPVGSRVYREYAALLPRYVKPMVQCSFPWGAK